MTNSLDLWLYNHPILGAVILLILAVLSLVFFSEISDGSRGGDASGTGQGCLAGPFLFLLFLFGSIGTFFQLITPKEVKHESPTHAQQTETPKR